MKLTDEQRQEKSDKIKERVNQANQKVFPALGVYKKQFQAYTALYNETYQSVESAHKDAEHNSKKIMTEAACGLVKNKVHPLFLFTRRLELLISDLLHSALEKTDIDGFKKAFTVAIEAHFEKTTLEPSTLDSVQLGLNMLLGTIIAIATCPLLIFSSYRSLVDTFFSWPNSLEERRDGLAGQYESELNDNLRDEIVEMVTIEEDEIKNNLS